MEMSAVGPQRRSNRANGWLLLRDKRTPCNDQARPSTQHGIKAGSQRLQRDWLYKKFGDTRLNEVHEAAPAGKADQQDDWHVRLFIRRANVSDEAMAIETHFPVEDDDIGRFRVDKVETGSAICSLIDI